MIGGNRYKVARKDRAGWIWVDKMEMRATAEKARQRAVVQRADLVMYEAGQGRLEALYEASGDEIGDECLGRNCWRN